MNDAGSEAKPTAAHATAQNLAGIKLSLGACSSEFESVIDEAKAISLVSRVWNKDASLWKTEAEHQKIISNALGWLTVADSMLRSVDDLETFAGEIKGAGFKQVMVCGMGGSSLCPEVLRQTFGRQDGFPELLVLDSTDPDTIENFRRHIDLDHCLFVIASKSGTTTEPNVFHRYWYGLVAERNESPGQQFITITDPGSQMVGVAQSERFRRVFENQSDIGGRYSALSYFGMTPAALMGLDVRRLLLEASNIARACQENNVHENIGAVLGAAIGACATKGRDKLTIVTDQNLSALGLWIEQLIAESTGKEGKGIVPVVDEPLGEAGLYNDDRLFVSVSVGSQQPEIVAKLKALEASGHPVVYRELRNLYDLGAEFFVWEFATAVAGWKLRINPFDQPNVQESKDKTKALLEAYKRDGRLPSENPQAREGSLAIYSAQEGDSTNFSAALRQFCGEIEARDYVAVLAYIEETTETYQALQLIRKEIRDATRCATTVGYGPRFLHSTGQLHKGGPDSGVFLQLTASDAINFPIPSEPFTMGTLKDAQALGDFQSLQAHGRRAVRIDLGTDILSGLEQLRETLKKVLSSEE